jgi:hypothetical protein
MFIHGYEICLLCRAGATDDYLTEVTCLYDQTTKIDMLNEKCYCVYSNWPAVHVKNYSELAHHRKSMYIVSG